MQDLDIARWRLRNQHLVSPYADSAREAVGSLLAVQAENPSQAAWAVASRTADPDQAELAALLALLGAANFDVDLEFSGGAAEARMVDVAAHVPVDGGEGVA